MKFTKHFPSSSMSGFANHPGAHQAAASQASAPPSALDIVQGQNTNTWESLLSPVGDASSTTLAEDSELMNSPSYLLGVPSFSSELESASAATDPLSWDTSSFSANRLRPSGLAPSMPLAYSSTFSMMPMDAQNYASYPFGSYPLLPVLSASPYEVSRNPLAAEEPPTTVSPAAVSLSQVAPLRPEVAQTKTTQSMKLEATPTPTKSRETSMEVDDDIEGDYDDEDMEDEDGGDEYKERSRGPRKDGKLGRPTIGSAARKIDAAASDSGSTGAKRVKNASSSKVASGSERGSTPVPTKRRGGNRIAVADFVPPDVSGLSKREARLVKNRAAAFLSRQRKREEFELMEVRLAEVLEENARLKSGAPVVDSSDEVQRLQELLRVAKEREQTLKKELEEKARLAEQARLEASMKVEEPTMTVQEALKLASPMVQSPRSDISSLDGSVLSSAFKEKDSTRSAHSGPGFNLMVLVFSLTLLGMPHQHQLQSSMRNGGAQPTRITYEPSGSSSTSAFPSLFENVLERWEGSNRIESLEGLEPVDEDDEMEVEVEPWEQEEGAADNSKNGNSYVVDFEMPVMADQVGKDDEGKIKVRISPVGVPRPRQASGILKPGELVWDGTPLPPVETSELNLGSSSFVADWETWGGWKEFLSDDIVGSGAYSSLMSDTLPLTGSVDEAFTPTSDLEHSTAVGAEDNSSERWATPPPFPAGLEMDTPSSAKADATLANVLSGEQAPSAPVDVDVELSTLPAWSRALVHAVAGEKLKARIRVSKKAKVAGRSRNTLSLGKKKMGLVVKV